MALFISVEMAAGELKIVQSSEIISKVEKGEPIDYSYVKISGDLNLKGVDSRIAEHITVPIRITDSIISGSIEIDNTILDAAVDFERTRFMGPAVFTGTHFNRFVDFTSSWFDEYASFSGSKFNDRSHFFFAKFNKSADFLAASFRGEADFHNSRFNGIANFKSAAFEDSAYFDEATFMNYAIFQEAQLGSANFVGSQFINDADFDSAQFNKTAEFIGAKFDRKLFLSDIKFSRLSITWDDIKYGLFCDGASYLLLIKNFKDLEQFEDADNCYYQYRDKKREDSPLGWGKFFDSISWLSCGYGVRWQQPILSGIVIAILFGMYFESYCLGWKAANFFHKEELKNPCKYSFFQNFKKSMSFSVMLLLSLPPEWSQSGRDEFTKFVISHWFSSILERLIGWGLVLLLIGTLTRLMVRY